MNARLLTPRALTMPALLSIEECRDHCRIDGTDDDMMLERYAAAAQAHVETLTGVWLTERTATARAGCWGPWWLAVGPLIRVDQIAYQDADGQHQALPSGQVLVTERLGVAGIRLRSTVVAPALAADSEIEIAMSIGHGDAEAPADLHAACLLLVGHYYRNREAVVTGTISSELPLAVEALCARHRLLVLA